MTAIEQNHSGNYINEKTKLFICTHTVYTSENTTNIFVDSFSLRAQTNQQHWW